MGKLIIATQPRGAARAWMRSSARPGATACRESADWPELRSRRSSPTPRAWPRCTHRPRGSWTSPACAGARGGGDRGRRRAASGLAGHRHLRAPGRSRDPRGRGATGSRLRAPSSAPGLRPTASPSAPERRPTPESCPFRGAYLRLVPEARRLVRGLIYPVPDPTLPFLGVHLTPQLDGQVLLGPTALMVGARDAYRVTRVRRRDLVDTLSWPGTWRMMRRWWRTGRERAPLGGEPPGASPSRPPATCPTSRLADLRPGFAGIRAQAVGRDGALVDDFVLFPDRPDDPRPQRPLACGDLGIRSG